MAQDTIAIDISDTEIKIADVHRNGPLFEAATLALGEADPLFYKSDVDKNIDTQVQNLATILTKNNIIKRSANVIIPDSYTYSRIVEMPKLNERELLSAVKYQADQFIPMPLEDTNLDIEILYDDLKRKKSLALIVAAPKKIVQKVERTMELTGIMPLVIETEISAVGRLLSMIFKPQPNKTDAGYLFINFGRQTTSLYFFDIEKNILIYSHNFPIGYNLFVKEIQVNLNVDRQRAADLLAAFGVTPNSSYHLETILAPAIKDFLTEIQHATSLITSSFSKKIEGVYLFNNSIKFHSFDVLVGKYLTIPSATLNISSFFVRNTVAQQHQAEMPYFIPSIGGNLT